MKINGEIIESGNNGVKYESENGIMYREIMAVSKMK
jgi:hypothetical protein